MAEQKNIMVVEDETVVGLLLINKLEGAGYKVSGGKNIPSGEEAVKLAGEYKPDLILMDIMLQGKMDGLEAAKLIKENNDIPVIYVTAFSDASFLERAKITDAFAYILKPFSERELFSNIEIALYKHKVELEIKEKNKQLKNYQEHLENLVQERTKELREASEKLKKSTQSLIETEKKGAIGLFAAGTANELNNPLMDIVKQIDLCLNRPGIESHFYDVLLEVKQKAERCISTVQNFLTFSPRVEGQLFYQADIAQLMNNVLKLLDYQLTKKKIKVNVSFPMGGLKASVVGNKIQQVFLNLLENAIDALQTSRTKEINIEGKYDADQVRISISDTGCGISEENRNKLFDPFFTTKSDGKGTGLGLPVAKNIMEEHGGKIYVESKLKEGTTFILYLPA